MSKHTIDILLPLRFGQPMEAGVYSCGRSSRLFGSVLYITLFLGGTQSDSRWLFLVFRGPAPLARQNSGGMPASLMVRCALDAMQRTFIFCSLVPLRLCHDSPSPDAF